jgi:hypothetical protein
MEEGGSSGTVFNADVHYCIAYCAYGSYGVHSLSVEKSEEGQGRKQQRYYAAPESAVD